MMVAEVYPKGMAGGNGAEIPLRVGGFGIEAGGFLIVSIDGIDVPAIEFGALGIGIGDVAVHGKGEQVIERDDVGEPAGTLERLEKMVGVDIGDILVGMVLKKLLTGDRVAQATQDAELAKVKVRDCCALVLSVRLRIEIGDRGEESAGEFGI